MLLRVAARRQATIATRARRGRSALASFTVTGNDTAEGRIVGNVAFMFLREQRIYATIDDEECDESTARTGRTTVAPYSVAGNYDASLAIGMKSPAARSSPCPTRPPS